MKIIKRGKVKKEENNINTCPKCDTIFSYSPEDVQSDRDGRYVECPVCSAFIAIQEIKKNKSND